MAILATFTKQPIDRLDYDFDAAAFLKGDDLIESAVFSIEPVGLELDSTVVEPTYTKVWVKGGAVGNTYKVICTITTERGRVKQDEIRIRIRES